jgi:TolA-binding protein
MTPEPAVDEREGDRMVDLLAGLARQSLTGDPTRRDEASFARVLAKVERRRASRNAPRVLALAAVVMLAIGGAWMAQRARAVTYAVIDGTLSGENIVGGAATKVRFSEGSELRLAPGAQAEVVSVDSHGAHVNLREGSAKVSITKLPGSAWTLLAGPYTVRVTGTAFSLRWSKIEQVFEISMDSGSVVVTGPLAASGMPLRAGQRMRSNVPTGKLTLEGAQSSTASQPVAAPASVDVGSPSPPGAAAESRDASAGSANEADRSSSAQATAREKLSWAQQAAAGEFDAVIDAATTRGISATLAGASLSELSALADSARYTRRADLARRAMLAQRTRFPSSSAARDAAFFLGRLVEDQGDARSALRWYERYLKDSPGGQYVSQALGRKMMLVFRQRDQAAARALAEDYLGRFPAGPYASAAGGILRGTKP